MNPVNQFGDRDANGVVHRTITTGSHQFVFVLEAWPVDAFFPVQIESQPYAHRHFDPAASNFAVALRGGARPKVKKRRAHIDRKVEGVSFADLGASMLPPNSAGTIELRASPFAGATPMHPRNGCNGKLTLKFESSA